VSTILSGMFSGPPILISPESAAGIKAGAKTGFSTVVCGVLFGISVFFSPLFAAVPPAGTAPLLIMVGVLLFQNAKRIDWYQPR
jgi:adenine/guanine/hypoxanthine permease